MTGRRAGKESGPWSTPTPEDRPAWCGADVAGWILGEKPGPVPYEWAWESARRLRELRDQLRHDWSGLDVPELGPLTDWLLAGAIARENVLLLGPPGTAKSEIATRFFKLLGLEQPSASDTWDELPSASLTPGKVRQAWNQRAAAERRRQKYFHYLLSRFTQPEELFGPIEISLLRQGLLVRVDFGLLTGPGVRAVFIDEVFKASSAILNNLLTITNERQHFNWGGMVPSDVLIFVAASNEMPGGFASGSAGVGASGEDFQTLHAFLDRFPIRLNVPPASATNVPDVTQSHLAEAFDKAFRREASRFGSGNAFGPSREVTACINDVLCLGRFCLQGFQPGYEASDPNPFEAAMWGEMFHHAFLQIANDLQAQDTSVLHRRVTWTLSPRKLKALYKIALAHALVRDDGFQGGSFKIELAKQDLKVLNLIWDTPLERHGLEARVNSLVDRLWKP